MIILIAAMDENNLIGNGNSLPWHLPDDLKHFKEMTINRPIIMGRKTWDSLPFKPLPKRHNIVLTRGIHIEGTSCFSSIEDAIEYSSSISDDTYVIGGASIYEQAMPYADSLLISKVHGTFEGDTYFPYIDPAIWTNISHIGSRDGFDIMNFRKD